MNKIVWVLMSVFSLVCAEELLDLETLPTVRTQQYPLSPYKKVVIFSAPRTGSCLVYNLFRYLFEDEKNLFCPHNAFDQHCLVLRTHRLHEMGLLKKESDVLFVIPIRNPIDSIISNFRICPHKVDSMRSFVEQKIQMHKGYLNYYAELKKSRKHLLFLRYEDFEGSIEGLCERIESHFGIHIHQIDKTVMEKGYGKNNVSTAIQRFSNFKECLPLSGFHGKHISAPTYTPPEELIYWLHLLIEAIKPEYKKYGYFQDVP